MASPDKLFCSVAERQFNAIVSLIEGILFANLFALKAMKSQIKRYEQLVLVANETILKGLEETLLSLLDLRKVPGFSNIEATQRSLCQAAYACRAVRETLFPPGGDPADDPVFVKMIPVSTRNKIRNGDSDAAEEWAKWVCKLSFRDILDQFIEDYLNWLEEQLDAILDALIIGFLDQLIAEYIEAIAPILRELAALEVFVNCVFEICNFTATALNKRDDYADKLSVEKQGPGWTFKIDSYIQSVYDYESDIRARTLKLKQDIRNTKVSFQRVDPDETVKIPS